MENNFEKQAEIVLYHTDNSDISVNAIVKDETIWMTQKAMADVFGCSSDNISLHLKNIYNEGELDKDSTTEESSVVQKEGNRDIKRTQNFYNLDAIIAVGYRVNSKEATKFRIWTTSILKEYIKKGYVLNDEKLKKGANIFGKDYFRELLERIRSIRASERRIWQQITDIFAECSIDYDKDSDITKEFYATVQNKFHYAITGKTAPEIIVENADHTKEHMGLKTWKNSPDGRILKSDTIVAKNYLQLDEIRRLERLVSGYFDYVEDIVERENTFTMKEFAASVNEFISFRKYDVLKDKGKVTREDANKKAYNEYDVFNRTQKLDSDFDKFIKNNKLV
ncbi:MAG: virulence RhuM family protein [Lachnospiraceae bacterium]|nr:virulence RhuM family protein [Lachnospiraceae bacterium]